MQCMIKENDNLFLSVTSTIAMTDQPDGYPQTHSQVLKTRKSRDTSSTVAAAPNSLALPRLNVNDDLHKCKCRETRSPCHAMLCHKPVQSATQLPCEYPHSSLGMRTGRLSIGYCFALRPGRDLESRLALLYQAWHGWGFRVVLLLHLTHIFPQQ